MPFVVTVFYIFVFGIAFLMLPAVLISTVGALWYFITDGVWFDGYSHWVRSVIDTSFLYSDLKGLNSLIDLIYLSQTDYWIRFKLFLFALGVSLAGIAMNLYLASKADISFEQVFGPKGRFATYSLIVSFILWPLWLSWFMPLVWVVVMLFS